MTVRTNLKAMFAQRNLAINQTKMQKALRRITTGYRINSAADDPAGLAVSEKMRGQIRGLKMASQNAQHAMSMLQTADGALSTMQDILHRMSELAVQASNATLSEVDRNNIQKEYDALMEELNRVAESANYNGIGLLGGGSRMSYGQNCYEILGLTGCTMNSAGTGGDGALDIVRNDDGSVTFTLRNFLGDEVSQTVQAGDSSVTLTLSGGASFTFTFDDVDSIQEGYISKLSLDKGITDQTFASNKDERFSFQIGAGGNPSDRLDVWLSTMHTARLGTEETKLYMTFLSTQEGAQQAIDVIKAAVNQISAARGDIGAQINRLEHTVNNLETTAINLQAAESRIRDADMAEEMMNYVKYSILTQAAQLMLAQSLQEPNYILKLLESL